MNALCFANASASLLLLLLALTKCPRFAKQQSHSLESVYSVCASTNDEGKRSFFLFANAK